MLALVASPRVKLLVTSLDNEIAPIIKESLLAYLNKVFAPEILASFKLFLNRILGIHGPTEPSCSLDEQLSSCFHPNINISDQLPPGSTNSQPWHESHTKADPCSQSLKQISSGKSCSSPKMFRICFLVSAIPIVSSIVSEFLIGFVTGVSGSQSRPGWSSLTQIVFYGFTAYWQLSIISHICKNRRLELARVFGLASPQMISAGILDAFHKKLDFPDYLLALSTLAWLIIVVPWSLMR